MVWMMTSLPSLRAPSSMRFCALGGRQLGELGVDLLGRGLGARARHRPDGENRQTDNRQTLHVRYLLLRAGFNRPGGIYAAKSSGRENVLQETRRFR